MNFNLKVFILAKSKVINGMLLLSRANAFDSLPKAKKSLFKDYWMEIHCLKLRGIPYKSNSISEDCMSADIDGLIKWNITEVIL